MEIFNRSPDRDSVPDADAMIDTDIQDEGKNHWSELEDLQNSSIEIEFFMDGDVEANTTDKKVESESESDYFSVEQVEDTAATLSTRSKDDETVKRSNNSGSLKRIVSEMLSSRSYDEGTVKRSINSGSLIRSAAGRFTSKPEGFSLFAMLAVFGVSLVMVAVFETAWMKKLPIKLSLFLAISLSATLIGFALLFLRIFNRKISSRNSIVTGFTSYTDPEPTKPFPEDSYSFLALYHPFHQTGLFCFGLAVYLFQISLLLVMVLNVLVPELRTTGEIDNSRSVPSYGTEIFPSNAGYLVRATQTISIMAYLFFPEESLLDITTAIELFPGFKDRDPAGTRKVSGLRLACILRLTQGLLSTLTVWLLVMTSSDVVEIILNFTAINFISNLDSQAFELADSGKYGASIQEAVENIRTEILPDCIARRCEHKRYKVGIAISCLVLYMITIIVMVAQDNSKVWVTGVVRVQFEDEARSPYSGCYHINEDRMIGRRYIYDGDTDNANSNAKIGYCKEKRKWLVFSDVDDPCVALGTEHELAHSVKTDTYEIESSVQEDWFTPLNTPIDDMYFIEADNLLETCKSFPGNGRCDDELLNSLDYQFDGGDCCATTCKGDTCGRVPGRPGERAFPFCKDPRMTYLTISPKYTKVQYGSILSLDCQSSEESGGERYNVFTTYNTTDVQPVMVERGFNCTLSYIPVVGNNSSVPFSYKVYHGYLSEKNPIDINEDSFQVPVPLYSRENEFLKSNIGLLTTLKFLELYDNDLTGSIPSEIGLMTSLTSLGIYNNSLADSAIPTEIALLTDLTWLYLVDNALTGPIPSEIGLITSLTALDLDDNFLTGSIPSEIGKLTDLEFLDLDKNVLTGSIPNEIGKLTAMYALQLDANELTGQIPFSIVKLTDLSLLWLDHNKFNGQIPNGFARMKDLTWLNLNDNDLTGPIPTQIGLLTELERLALFNNELTGSIPTEIGLMTTLTSLDLYNNSLIGPIPSEIGKLRNLTHVELYDNDFTGQIPSEIGLLSKLLSLKLSENELTGVIPSEIGKLTNMDELHLSHNTLSGTLPSQIGILKDLEFLYLDGNALTGKIPSEIGLLTTLDILYLNDNPFTGTVPDEITKQFLLRSESNFRMYLPETEEPGWGQDSFVFD